MSRAIRRACIDIGSNTTRLLVADCHEEGLREIDQQREFTRVGKGLALGGLIAPEKLREVAGVVAAQLERARALGASEVRIVATAAIRRAANGGQLAEEIHRACGLPVEILSGEDEARLAFCGAARALGHRPTGDLGVVDVGGGSSEIIVGLAPDQVRWSASLRLGSGDLTDAWFHSDPPTAEELDRARLEVKRELDQLAVPRPEEAVAVGGSATSLGRLAGPLLDQPGFEGALELLLSEPAAVVAGRFALDAERVRLLPGGLLILREVSSLFEAPLRIARGGVREGVLLEARG